MINLVYFLNLKYCLPNTNLKNKGGGVLFTYY
jgi:hypothetical protein